jgi:hypothetical protein
MERYYEHLFASDRSTTTTNKFKDWTFESSDKETNSFFGGTKNDGDVNVSPFDGLFNSRSTLEVFEPDRAATFSDVFDSNPRATTTPNDETMRAREEEKAHMDAFKQMWDIDQPVSSSLAPAPVSSDSAPGEGSFTGIQPVLGAASPSLSASAEPETSSSPQSPLASERANSMLMHPPQFNNSLGGGH